MQRATCNVQRSTFQERIVIAGSGGQGIVLIGRMLAGMALPYVAHITFFPAYGAEVRGGLSNCQLVFSETAIASPVGAVFDSMILMNAAGAARYRAALRPGGGPVIFDRDLCPALSGPGSGVAIPATGMADAMGDRRAANFVMLGAWMAARGRFPPDRLEAEVAAVFDGKPERVRALNIAAFRAGFEAVAGR